MGRPPVLLSELSRYAAPLRAPADASADAPRWELDALAGRLTELCACTIGAQLTCAFGLVHEAQQRGEPAAYVGSRQSSFFPPDADEGGIDLAALVVVRTAERRTRARAAEELLRSGAFALVIVDLVDADADAATRVAPAMLTRLHGLAQKHASAVLFLSDADEAVPSQLGSLVSLRAVARRHAVDESRVRFRVALEAVKDKRRAPGWRDEEICRAPVGLR